MPNLNDEIREALVAKGAALVGFADMSEVEEEARQSLPRAISMAVALTPRIVAEIRNGPTEEYVGEYDRRNEFLFELGDFAAAFIRQRGYNAVAKAPTKVGVNDATLSTVLPNKTAATRAGLGWIGKCALLVTPEYGSAVRFATVLTDAPLAVGTPADESRCGDCAECVDACPGRAASGKEWRLGMRREEFFDAFACRDAAREQAARLGLSYSICGRCISVCPYTERYLRRERAISG